ncbi:MAG TPA: hypothetical protein VIS94_14760 [Desulfomonilia bacterium]
MNLIDETSYMKKVIAIEDARKNISKETSGFDISQLWEKWAIGGLSRRVMNELGLTEISGDPRWDHMLDDSITAVYSDDAGRVWVAEDSSGKINMRLSASDTVEFEKLVTEHYNINRKAA